MMDRGYKNIDTLRLMDNPQAKRRKLITEYFQNVENALAYIPRELEWEKIERRNLNLDYTQLFPSKIADVIFSKLEKEIQYYTGDLACAKFNGKLFPIPRQHSAYGNCGITYTFSGTTVPAQAWTPLLTHLRECVERASGYKYNFVLVNKYRTGSDSVAFHRDNERDLVKSVPIASLSFGQARDFILKPYNFEGSPLTVNLKNGSLLVMNNPTNEFWVHSLPKTSKRITLPRINLTFRSIRNTQKHSNERINQKL